MDRSGTPWTVPRLHTTRISALVVERPGGLQLEVSFWWSPDSRSTGTFDPGRWDPIRVVKSAAHWWVCSVSTRPTRTERAVRAYLAEKVASLWASDEAFPDWIRPMEEADALAMVMRS